MIYGDLSCIFYGFTPRMGRLHCKTGVSHEEVEEVVFFVRISSGIDTNTSSEHTLSQFE